LPKNVRIAALVSGNGTNLDALLAAIQSERWVGIEVVLVLSSNPDAYALTRAKKYQIATAVVDYKAISPDEEFQSAVLAKLIEANVDVVCLAGYLKKLGPGIIRRYQGRILNIHPALLPKFGGAGMYGHYVHDAVLAAGEKESGCTIHVVDEEFDHGPVLAQVKVPVKPGDTALALAARVLEAEHKLYPKVVKEFCEKIRMSGVPS
jgi:phosphoribosylglycinamide formyltransferase-1